MSRGVTRRQVLSGLGVGVVGSMAGCGKATSLGGREPASGDWPMFGHDPANTGVSSGSPGPSGPGERWRFGIDRGITASPAVVGGTVYLTALEGSIYALDAATGERLWLSAASFPLFGTPAVEGGIVYVSDGGGYLHALSEGRREGSDGEGPARHAGEFLWQVRGHAGFTASPTVVDGSVYLGTYEGDLHAFDATDGTSIWVDILGDNVDVAPAVSGGTVYATVPRGVVYALDAESGGRIWQTPLRVALTKAPVVYEGSVLVGSSDTSRYGQETRVFSLDAGTGEREWDAPLDGGSSGSPAVIDGIALVATWGGVLHAFDTDDGTERWRVSLDHGITTAPVVAGSRAYIGTLAAEIHAVSVADGTLEWSTSTGKGFPQSLTVAGDAVYAATDANEVLAIGA